MAGWIRKRGCGLRAALLGTALLIILLPSTVAADAIGQELKSLKAAVRQAENDMFAGHSDRAIASLDDLLASLGQLKAASPEDPQIKQIERKLLKLVKDLERRTGKELGGGTATSAPAAAGSGKAPPKTMTPAANALARDVDALEALYQQARPMFNHATGTPILYTDMEPVENLLSEIEAFESRDKPRLEAALSAFGNRYGRTAAAIDDKAVELGYRGLNKASFPYTAIAAGLEKVSLTRSAMAADLIRKASRLLDQSDRRINDLRRMRLHDTVRAYADMAARFDADHPRVKVFSATLEDRLDRNRRAMLDRVDRTVWSGSTDTAPENAADLILAARAELQKEIDRQPAGDNNPRRILAIAVRGPWTVFKRNILEEPVQFALPVSVALQLESERPLDLARVYELTLLTEERRGVTPSPPFLGSTLENSYYIRPSAISLAK
jgi:hypothetical protein